MTRIAVLLKPNVAKILVFNFCEQKFVQHGPLTIAIDCSSLSLLISKKNCPIMTLDQHPHQTVTRYGCVGFSMYPCGFSVMSLIWTDNFFLAKIGIFCKSIPGPNIANILLQFMWTKIRSTIAIDCNALSLLIIEAKWPNYASGSKSTPNSDSFWVRRLYNVCVRVFCAPNATILLV